MKKILIVVGTRPNFIKITQFRRIVAKYPNLELKIAHTGQHFDANMAEIFFNQFDLKPDYFLEIEPNSPAVQMGEIMMKLDQLLAKEYLPDLIITPGDVNSTLAVSIVANKRSIKLAHLESGLRSRDRSMPEEINRILTDEISDYFFVTEKSGIENLSKENKKGEIFFVGNTMIDTIVAFDEQISASTILEDLSLDGEFALMTIHRPSNVDSLEDLQKLLHLLNQLASKMKVVFPMHPRTVKRIEDFNLTQEFESITNLIRTGAIGYFEFQNLVKNCKLVITDSGGIQEETTFRKVPCLTLRKNTERPITVDIGSNTLVSFDIDEIMGYINEIELKTYKNCEIPDLWDGKATERIVAQLNQILAS